MSSSKARGKKRNYERTTAVGRVFKNIQKAMKVVGLVIERMLVWEGTNSIEVSTSLSQMRNAQESLALANNIVVSLHESDWKPPKKSTAVTFREGEEVKVVGKYREKYLKIYTPVVVDNLMIAKICDTGEIAVRHGSQTPFMVPKSHIEHVRQEG